MVVYMPHGRSSASEFHNEEQSCGTQAILVKAQRETAEDNGYTACEECFE